MVSAKCRLQTVNSSTELCNHLIDTIHPWGRYGYFLEPHKVHYMDQSITVNMYCTCLKKHKPLGPIAECPFWSLSASVEPEEDSEAVSPFASVEKKRSFNMAACFIKVDRMS